MSMHVVVDISIQGRLPDFKVTLLDAYVRIAEVLVFMASWSSTTLLTNRVIRLILYKRPTFQTCADGPPAIRLL